MSPPTSISRFPLADSDGSTRAVAACADRAGLEHFAYQLFCQAAEQSARSPRTTARLTAAAINPQRLKETAPPTSAAPPIPLAYQLWISHLLWLEEVLETLDCRPSELTSAELAGLQAVARARARFLHSHQVCPHCQGVNPRSGEAARCRRCHREL